MPSGRRHVTGPCTEIHSETRMISKAYFDGPLLIAYPCWASSSSSFFVCHFSLLIQYGGKKKRSIHIYNRFTKHLAHTFSSRRQKDEPTWQRGYIAKWNSGKWEGAITGKKGLLGQRTSKQQIEHIQINIL